MAESFILEIDWEDRPNLPRLVGPFKDRPEAHEWAALNVVNGSWTARSLTYPYLRSTDHA